MFKKITIYIVLALLYLVLGAVAQEPTPQITPLKVGDKLPETFWQQEHTIYANGKTTKQTLEQYKGKLLILDFWATWCGSCINKFRTIETLQAQFEKEAAFVLVNTNKTRDDEQKIAQLFSGKKYNTRPYLLTTIYRDGYIAQLFPHGYMPYYVLISPSAEVRAIVPAELITAENIKTMLEAYGAKTKKGGNHG